LLDIMSKDDISKAEKIEQLKAELALHFSAASSFQKAKTMGQLVKMHLKQLLRKNLLLVPKTKNRFDD
jgi:hypothetical protein